MFGAMHKDVLVCMQSNLITMHDRMVDVIPFNMTHEECIQLIADAEHIPMLTQAAKFADIAAAQQWLSIMCPRPTGAQSVLLYMRTHGDKEPPLRPRHPYWHPGTPACTRVLEWVNKRVELAQRFALADFALRHLAEICETGAQVRYIWPVCMHLLQTSNNGRVQRWAEKYGAYKAQRFMPTLSPALRAAIQDSCALITSAALLGTDVPSATADSEVLISIGSFSSYEFHGVEIEPL